LSGTFSNPLHPTKKPSQLQFCLECQSSPGWECDQQSHL
jgi:hypothetical protein